MRTPFPFDHLTLAEVAECERLRDEIVGKYPGASKLKGHRLAELLRKRHRPLYGDDGPRAA